MRFYGESVEATLAMPSRRYFGMLEAIDRLEAREALLALAITTNPQKSEHQEDLWKQLKKTAAAPVNMKEEYARGRAFLEARMKQRK